MCINDKIKGLSELKNLSIGNSAIKIALLDGFPDLEHSCFNRIGGKLIPYAVQVNPSASGGLALKHGTAVCSLIFGKPGSLVEGVAPGCSGVILPIYSQDNNGNFFSASQVLLARAIEMAIEQEVHIINISGGQFSKTGDPDVFLSQAIEKCYKKGILIVAATGNEGCECLHVPAAHQLVLAVGSMDENGEPTAETNFGNSYQVNGILAPGINLTAALPGGGTFETNGATSYATPIVSGVVALLMSHQIECGFPPNAYIIRSILEKTAISCIPNRNRDCRRFMRGKLNIPGVLELINSNPTILISGINYIPPLKLSAMDRNILNSKSHASIGVEDVLAVEPSCNNENCSCNNENQTRKDDDERKRLGHNSEPILLNEELMPSATINNASAAVVPQSSFEELNDNNHQPERQKPLLNNFLKSETMETAKINLNKSIANPNLKNSKLSVNASGEIDPSDCGCGGGKVVPPAIVYALGTVGYDFGSESHRDSFIQSMGDGRNPHNPADLIAYLRDNPWDASELLWTLNIDATPIYALFPTGPYSNVAYERIVSNLEEQQNGNIQRISVPGVAEGTTSLLNGQAVTNLFPNLRGMYSWTTSALVAATAAGEKGASRVLAENVTNFLNRIYYKMRNLGVTAEERALNYSATNAYQVSAVFASALNENLELDDIVTSKSPICRIGSDCYDVVLTFFNPRERLTQARREYRFTVDVSDVVPVTVGEVRSWSVY
jgi:cyanobactin maturation PatA/PatG family protease